MRRVLSAVPAARVAALVVVLALGLAGCSEEEDGSVPAEDLQADLLGELAADAGIDTADLQVTCPDDLAGQAGATTDCTVVSGATATGVRVSVSGVQGSDVEYETVLFLAPDAVADSIRGDLETQGYALERVTCDDELLGDPGKTTTCVVTQAGGTEQTIEVTATSGVGVKVDFDYRVVS